MAEQAGPVVVLCGGVGAARFLEGLVRVVPPETVVAIVNVGDDLELYGLHISPDLDTVTYTLAGLVDPAGGWGRAGDSFHVLESLRALGDAAWFRLGDRDLALHLYRTQRLRDEIPLSAITAEIASTMNVPCRLLPVTDERLRTIVETPAGEMPFQEYFVRRRAEDSVVAVRFDGAERTRAAPGVHAALMAARAIVIAPSNPFLSIGPILAVPGIRDCLLASRARVAAVSPIVAGRAIKGPTARILASLGHDVSALGVARLYQDLIDLFVLDNEDADLADAVQSETGAACAVTETLMSGPAEKEALARATLEALAE